MTSCSSFSCGILFTGDAREGREARLLDGRSVAGGVSGRSDDSKPSDRVSAWVSDGAEATGDALVVVETDAVTTGKIGFIRSHMQPVQSTCSWRQWLAIFCCNYGGILDLVDVEVVPSEKDLPDHLLPLVQGEV